MQKDVKPSNQRVRILYLYKIFNEQTDELHPISTKEIISELRKYGFEIDRRTVYSDIEALSTFGLDIIATKGNTSCYYIANRDFELPELKLLADAVSSSRFLTEKKSSVLIKKIAKLTSVHEGKQIQRQVYVANRVKSMNERIYLNVDVISRAIDEKKQISFLYFDYDLKKEKRYRDGARVCHPYALSWDGERYYLIAFYDKYDEISNFRVDRMEKVEILDIPARAEPKGFDVAEYINSSFSMFSGDEQYVTLRFENHLINVVIDRFGKDISISAENDGRFTVRVKVKPTPTFFAWIAQFGREATIIEPQEVKNEYIEQLQQALEAAEE